MRGDDRESIQLRNALDREKKPLPEKVGVLSFKVLFSKTEDIMFSGGRAVLKRILLWMVYFSWIFWLYACFLVKEHFGGCGAFIREGSTDRLPAGFRGRQYEPPVSILKPACGRDYELLQNLTSFCRQDYGRYEIIVGVESLDDPAVEDVQELKRSFPQIPIKLVVGKLVGANRKVSLLHSMVAEASYDVLVISDSDIRVGRDYLKTVVTPMADPEVGLVTCPYVGDKALSPWARLEALHMGGLFLPSTVVAWRLGVVFALGATVVIRKKDLEAVGGFKSFADYLADDFQIGYRVASIGLKPVLSTYAVRSVLGHTTLADEWYREVRWARCQRVSRPLEYPGILLTLTVFLSALFFVFDDFSPWSQQVLLVSLIIRYLTCWYVADVVGDKESKQSLHLLPLREILSAVVWLYGSFGRRIAWRGKEYVLEREGRMRISGD